MTPVMFKQVYRYKDFNMRLENEDRVVLESLFSKVAKELFTPKEPMPHAVVLKGLIDEAKSLKLQGMTPAQHRTEVTLKSTGIFNRAKETPKAYKGS
jgi:hypothetical protein